MNPKFTLSLTAGICFSVLAVGPHISTEHAGGKEIEKKKSTVRARTDFSSSRNNHAVKIYPDIIKKTMHVIAKENDGKEIDFFVFDLQGVLLKHYKMEEGEHQRIAGLSRGKYIYHVFSGDEETATGKFDIR